jgi:hypothetical protein
MSQPISTARTAVTTMSVMTGIMVALLWCVSCRIKKPLAQADMRRAVSALSDDFARAVVSVAAAEFCLHDFKGSERECDLATSLFERRVRQIDGYLH